MPDELAVHPREQELMAVEATNAVRRPEGSHLTHLRVQVDRFGGRGVAHDRIEAIVWP